MHTYMHAYMHAYIHTQKHTTYINAYMHTVHTHNPTSTSHIHAYLRGCGLYAPGPGTVAAGCGANDALSLPVDTAAAAVTSGSVIGR